MPHSRRACDRCYKKKEKCSFATSSEICVQCQQSAAQCTTQRSQLRPGRKPKSRLYGKSGSLHVWDTISYHTNADAEAVADQSSTQCSSSEVDSEVSEGSRTPEGEGSEPEEDHSSFQVVQHMLRRNPGVPLEDFFDLQGSNLKFFYATNDIFMLGPGFAEKFHCALQKCYEFSPEFLRDSYQAMFTALVWARHEAASYDQVDISKGAKSLRKLRTANIHSIADATAVVSLGPTLAAFDVLTRCVGSVSILRHSLSVIKSWYPRLSEIQGLDPIIISPIFWDTTHSLIRREVPVLRYQPRESGTIDRVAGFCTTLMPILYDICLVNHTSKHCTTPQPRQIMNDLQEKVTAWSPTRTVTYDDPLSDQELLILNVQASMYRTTALLVIHRIWNLVGQEDEAARLYAEEIIWSLSQFLSTVRRERKLQHVAFPVFLAALEIPDLSKEIWKHLSLLNGPSICLNKLLKVIDNAWNKRNAGFKGSLFDLLDEGPDFVIIP